jgi:hypothetical protein
MARRRRARNAADERATDPCAPPMRYWRVEVLDARNGRHLDLGWRPLRAATGREAEAAATAIARLAGRVPAATDASARAELID